MTLATSGKICSPAKTARGAPSKQQHTTMKERKKALAMLPCLIGPYAPAAYFLSTMRTSPTKLVGNLTHIPINTLIDTICEILIIFLYIHYIPTPQGMYFCGHHFCSILLLSLKP